jgi:hypothetical protein
MEISLGVLAYKILEVRKPLRSSIYQMDGQLEHQVIINVTLSIRVYAIVILLILLQAIQLKVFIQ